ncbi:MAG TPA: response regulator [Bacteroidales bacterium]|nr:response regulator [Bacteroidales bacterium]
MMDRVDYLGHKILVVEDDLQNYQLIEFVAGKNNIEVYWAKNGLESIELCKQHDDFSLILMDVKMPLMDGFEATRKIRVLRPEVPIVMITGFVNQDSLRMAVAAGCNDYLSKPMGISQLTAVFRKWLVK